MPTGLESLRDRLLRLTPAQRLLVASELLMRGEDDPSAELAVTIAQGAIDEVRTGRLLLPARAVGR